MIGALILGLAETADRDVHLPGVGDGRALRVVFAVLLVRPQGLLGTRLREDAVSGMTGSRRRAREAADPVGSPPMDVRADLDRPRSPLVVAVLLLLYPVAPRRPLLPEHDHPLAGLRDRGAGGLNIITGYAGYVSLGQGAFLGLGAYTVGDPRVNVRRRPARGSGCRSAASSPALVAALLGAGRAARAAGTPFVIITIAFLFLVQIIAINWRRLTERHGRHHSADSRRGASTSRTGPSTTRCSGCSCCGRC